MVESLGRLGIRIESRDNGTSLIVHGCGGKIPAKQADLFVGNSGTTIRFLTAMCTLGLGTFRLDGIERMRERPIGDLLDAMNQLGGNCRGQSQENFPPVTIRATGLRGGSATIRGDISSQFLSGLLMAAPLAAADVWLVVEGELVSKPYVAMTTRIAHAFGPRIETQANYSRFHIAAPQRY